MITLDDHSNVIRMMYGCVTSRLDRRQVRYDWWTMVERQKTAQAVEKPNRNATSHIDEADGVSRSARYHGGINSPTIVALGRRVGTRKSQLDQTEAKEEGRERTVGLHRPALRECTENLNRGNLLYKRSSSRQMSSRTHD